MCVKVFRNLQNDKVQGGLLVRPDYMWSSPGADQNMLKPNQILSSRTFLSAIEAAPKKDTPLQTQCISVWKTDNK